MLLQDLFKEENKNLKNAYSINLDENSSKTEYATPPDNLEEIGFIFKIDEDGMMDEALMDIVISYRLTNLPILMEVPTQLIASGKLEVKYLIQLANNVDFSIALLPSGHDLVEEDISADKYKEILMLFLEEMLLRPNFDKQIYPISNFFEYLMLEQVIGEEKLKNFVPEFGYIQKNFVKIMTKENSDDFKSEIRKKLYEFYDGKENFELMATTMIEGVLEKTEFIYKDFLIHSNGLHQKN